jgi:hypothetical protein
MDNPPNKGDVFELPAGKTVTTEIACTKAATSFFASGQGGDGRDGNIVCPNSPMAAFHTNGESVLQTQTLTRPLLMRVYLTGISGLGGCGLAIAYKNDVHAVKPEDFSIFSVNHQCVWNRFTDFDGACFLSQSRPPTHTIFEQFPRNYPSAQVANVSARSSGFTRRTQEEKRVSIAVCFSQPGLNISCSVHESF